MAHVFPSRLRGRLYGSRTKSPIPTMDYTTTLRTTEAAHDKGFGKSAGRGKTLVSGLIVIEPQVRNIPLMI